jgi:sec-independent protein translocase protein TatA
MLPLFGPVPGGMEMVVILLIAVLLFGANKIPKLARSTGEAMGEFKKGRQEVEQELEDMAGEDLAEDEQVDLGGGSESETASNLDTEK